MQEALENTSASPALRVRNLEVFYGERRVLDGIDLTVERGEIRVILGGSGSGKSTCLKGILGLATARGTVEMLGQEVTQLEEAGRRRHFQRIGVLFQHGALFGSLTVAENVAVPLRVHRSLPPAVVREMVQMKLELVGLAHASSQLPAALSGGMRKRAALARAMVLDPELLFCDEPSAGLDPLTSAELDALILRLKGMFGMTVVVVTHELASIEAIADSVLMLGGGKVIAEGKMKAVRAARIPEVERFFGRQLAGEAAGEMSVASLFGLTTPKGGPA